MDDEDNTFLHVAARSGALRSVQVSNTLGCVDSSKLYDNPTGSDG